MLPASKLSELLQFKRRVRLHRFLYW